MTAEGMAALHAACFTTPRPWSGKEIAALLAMPDVFCLQADDAFLLGRAVVDEAELLTLAVAPLARRQGKGRTLVARFEAEARTRGAQTAFLEVAASNTVARALYAELGYRQAGARNGYYRRPDGQAETALILTKSLANG